MGSTRRKSQTWQQSLAKAREMRGHAGAALYDRMVLLVNVFEDSDWRLRTGVTDESKWLDMLNEEVSDVFLTFGELRDMLAYAPERAQWTDGRLDKLRAKMIEDRRAAKRKEKEDAGEAGEADKPVRNYVTKEDLATVEHEKAQVEQKLMIVEGEHKSLAERVRELEAENRKLRADNLLLVRDNARLEGRVAELERMVRGEFAAA